MDNNTPTWILRGYVTHQPRVNNPLEPLMTPLWMNHNRVIMVPCEQPIL